MSVDHGRLEEPHLPRRRAPGRFRQIGEDAARRSFLRLVSHELRTPLNSIIGFSEIIARELYGPIGEPRYREHAEMVRDAGLRLLKLVNDVVEVARLEAGVVDLDLHAEDPLTILQDVAEAMESVAAARRVTLAIDEPVPGQVLADERGLKTALIQLVQNAIAFSPEGGTVRLSLRRTRDAMAFDVCDDGPGVDAENLKRILQPFEQVENALTRRSEGAGLGLPIARLLTEAMGGRLRLHSEPGQGLCASIHLPIAP